MTKDVIIGAVVLLAAVAGIFYFAGMQAPPSPDEPVSNEEDMAVRQVVADFGEKLKEVPLLAPGKERAAAMETAFSAYVAPELLATWAPEGAEALGRYTSSPWPDRIEIVEVRSEGVRYVVEGNGIEVGKS